MCRVTISFLSRIISVYKHFLITVKKLVYPSEWKAQDQTISLKENQPFFVSLDVWSSANWWVFLQSNYIGKHWRKLKVSILSA
jgi:hypothetical protein